MKILIDKEGNAWSDFGPRVFDWGLLILCILNLLIVLMLTLQQARQYVYQQETRERVDVIYEVMTIAR